MSAERIVDVPDREFVVSVAAYDQGGAVCHLPVFILAPTLSSATTSARLACRDVFPPVDGFSRHSEIVMEVNRSAVDSLGATVTDGPFEPQEA